jgi:hypothetical protein
MSKLISLASFAALALTAGLAHAEPPCPGSNDNGCSWTCTDSTYHVTCQNTSVGGLVPRCYDVTGSNVTNVPCDMAPPSGGDEIDAAFEMILEVEDGIWALEEDVGVCYGPTKGETAEEPITEEGLAPAY